MNRPIFQRIKLTRAPMGYFRTLPADGGDISPPPHLLSAKLLGRLPIRKKAFNSSGLELSKYVAKFYL